jgi:hypothetical protein
MNILPVIIGVAILIAAFALLSRRRASTVSTPPDLQLGMEGVAAEAVEVARTRYNTSLDYSPESVALLEANILQPLHEQHRKETFPLAREKDEAWRWGAYVGEVILRLTAGHWEVDHVAGGPRSYPVVVGRGASFPMGWCRKRILNGPEDNVWHKLQILYLNQGEPRDGTSAPPSYDEP